MFHSSFSNKISEMSTSSQNKEISVEILSAYLQENRIASYIETAGILSISFSSHYRTLLHFPSMYTISSPVRLGELVWGGVYPFGVWKWDGIPYDVCARGLAFRPSRQISIFGCVILPDNRHLLQYCRHICIIHY
jgi:hypothetical protein